MLDPTPEIAAAEAIAPVPQGQRPCSEAAASQIEGAAKGGLPQGQAASAATLDHLCGTLMKWQRDRRFAIRQQMRCDAAVLAYIRLRLGFRTDMSDAERKKISAEARRIKEAIEQGQDQIATADEAMEAVILSCSMVVLRNITARAAWDEMRDDTETRMRKLARDLPAWPFVERVKGLSDLGLAVIVGEAGNLGDYPKKGHLWKRLGLAVIDGARQGNPGTGASAEEWIAHGYNRQRRAEVYAFLDDVMFRAQWRGAKDDAPAHARGPYGEHYARKKAEYLAWEWTPKHADKAARRYMAKMLIRDLWNAWRADLVSCADEASVSLSARHAA